MADKLAQNRVAPGRGVYHPGVHSHVKSKTKPAPMVNKSAANQAAGVQPGQDSLMTAMAYQTGNYAKPIKKDSPARPLR
jgi:hypothetical protein